MRRAILLSVILTCSAGLAGAAGCGGRARLDAGSAGESCSTLPDAACVEPPSIPSGATPTSIKASHTYAIHRLYLGDTDRSGVASPTAWQSFGYDLDGLVTTSQSTGVCVPAPGAPTAAQQDGVGGIDNSFGENVLPLLLDVDGSVSAAINTSIDAGRFTLMTYVAGFDDSAGNATTATGLTGALLYGGKDLALRDASPDWTPSTQWPVLTTSLDCPSTGCPAGIDPITAAAVQFPQAAQVAGAFVSNSPARVTLVLSVAGLSVPLNIQGAVITFEPLAPGAVTHGTIAGVLSTSDVVGDLQANAGLPPDAPPCESANLGFLGLQVEQASDIVLGADGETISNGPGVPCNAISIGIGFDATEIATPTPEDVVEPPEAGGYGDCDD